MLSPQACALRTATSLLKGWASDVIYGLHDMTLLPSPRLMNSHKPLTRAGPVRISL